MRFVFLFFLIILSLFGRENPFVPMGDLNSSVMTTNIKEEYEEFEKLNIKFPSNSALLLGVKFIYRANDGSIKEKIVDINQTINFKNDYSLIKLSKPNIVESKKLDVSVTKPENSSLQIIAKQELNNTNEQANSISLVKSEPKEPTKVLDTPHLRLPLKSIKFMDFLKFDAYATSMKIITKDKIIKHFIYEKDRIVIDFKHHKSFKSKKIELDCGVFKDIHLGWHKKFYRVVFKLDKAYKYEILPLDDGFGYELKIRLK